MRFGVQILNFGTTLNSFYPVPTAEIGQGETVSLYFRLVDKEQKDLRYVPASGATVFVEIARFPEYFATNLNQRTTSDFSIRRAASNPFADDRSIWSLALSAADTTKMMSSNIRFTLTEGVKVSIALVPQALKILTQES